MNIIWLLLLLLVLTLMMVFYPLFRSGSLAVIGSDRGQSLRYRRDLLLRQMKEVEDDVVVGAIAVDEAAQSRAQLEAETAQIFLQLDQQALSETSVTGQSEGNEQRSVNGMVALLLMMTITLASGGLYMALGTPFPDQNVAVQERGGSAQENHSVEEMVNRLAERLKNEPNDFEGYMQLARSYLYLEKINEAIAAYTHILDRNPNHLAAAIGLGEAELSSQNPELMELGFALFERIYAKNPEVPEALWFTGIAAERQGDSATALLRWKKLLSLLPQESPARQSVRNAIAKVEQKR